jgi:hypothetical protein
MNKNQTFAMPASFVPQWRALLASPCLRSLKRGKPSGVPVGPMVAYPEVDLTFKSNDNIYSQPASGTRKSSNITVIAPKIKLEAKDGPHTYDAGYRRGAWLLQRRVFGQLHRSSP